MAMLTHLSWLLVDRFVGNKQMSKKKKNNKQAKNKQTNKQTKKLNEKFKLRCFLGRQLPIRRRSVIRMACGVLGNTQPLINFHVNYILFSAFDLRRRIIYSFSLRLIALNYLETNSWRRKIK